jgi:hypothetical protein
MDGNQVGSQAVVEEGISETGEKIHRALLASNCHGVPCHGCERKGSGR